MKGLAELIAENDELVRRADKRRAASIRRLKQRIARIFIDEVTTYDRIYAAIDRWYAAEQKRGAR